MSAHEDQPYYHAHHFHTMDQQNASLKLGMWAFLVQELLFFWTVHGIYIHAILLPRDFRIGTA